jgi:surfactin synthase thioesterase subunit
VCFPHAGGSASAYRSWTALLPDDVELLSAQYPGRQDRLAEPCLVEMDQLADAVCTALAPSLDLPVALFGHSMGASLAHEVALRLERAGAAPLALLVSARMPPRHHQPRIDTWDDQALLADVLALDPDSEAILADPDMRALMLPAIRADYLVADTYRPEPDPVVGVPVVAYVGDRDPYVSVWQLRAWSEVTKSNFQMVVFPGKHFYLRSAEVELVQDISGRLVTNVPTG